MRNIHRRTMTGRSWSTLCLICFCLVLVMSLPLQSEMTPFHCAIVNPELGTPEVVKTAFKPFFDFLTKRVGRPIVILIRDDVTTVIDELKTGLIDFGYTGVIDFLKIEAGFPIKPGITFLKNGRSDYTGCFTVLKASQDAALVDFKDKRLGFISFHKVFSGFFPEILLAEKGYPGPLESFFSQVTPYYSDVAAIRDLLEKKVDACVVSESSIKILSETSPVLTQNLHVLYRQEGLMFAPIFYREDMDPELREELIKAAFDFFSTSSGKQFMMMFKVDGITRIVASDYDTDRQRAIKLGYIPAKRKK